LKSQILTKVQNKNHKGAAMTLNKIRNFETTTEAKSFAGAVVIRQAGAELFWTESSMALQNNKPTAQA
jgi:hypothetical protein